MRERETAMRKMVRQAFSKERPHPKGKRVRTFMRPTKASDSENPQLQQIDLTQRSITEDSARTDSESELVRERFQMAAAVQSALEGTASKDFHEAAQKAAQEAEQEAAQKAAQKAAQAKL